MVNVKEMVTLLILFIVANIGLKSLFNFDIMQTLLGGFGNVLDVVYIVAGVGALYFLYERFT